MKNLKSMVLSAVAALIVAAGPEVAAPLFGADNSAMAQAVKPQIKCKPGAKVRPAGTVLKSGKITLKDRCVINPTKKPRTCKAGASLVDKTVKGKATKVCKKTSARPKVVCKLPKVLQTKGTLVKRKVKVDGVFVIREVATKADRCVVKKN